MTMPETTPEMLAMADRIADETNFASDREWIVARDAALAAIKETTELAAKLAEKRDGYNDVTGSSIATALRNQVTLEPCPFCNGLAAIHSPRYPISADCDDALVRCHDCDAQGPAILCDMSDEDAETHWPSACKQAITAWNTRTQPAISGGEVERVARAIDPDAWQEDLPVPTRAHTIAFHADRAKSIVKARASLAAMDGAPGVETFQRRVGGWMLKCFTPEITADKLERSDRFIEEALELVQACDYSASRAHALVDYVFNRPVGEPSQEVGGVMVTLAALCNTYGMDITGAAETELARILQPAIVEKIRAKQAAKPTGSALPIPQPEPRPVEAGEAFESCPKCTHGKLRPKMLCDECGIVFLPVRAAIEHLRQQSLSAARAEIEGLDWKDAKAIAACVVQNACETDPADAEHPDTILITTDDLETIVRSAVEDYEKPRTAALSTDQGREGE